MSNSVSELQPFQRLKAFRVIRAGYHHDGDELRAALRCSTQDEYAEIAKTLQSVTDFSTGSRLSFGFQPPIIDLQISWSDGTIYTVPACAYEHALRVEELLGPYRHRIIDPPYDDPRCICPKYHPHYFAASEPSEPAPLKPGTAQAAPSGFDEELRRNRVSLALLEALQRAYADEAMAPSSWLTSVLQQVQDTIQQGHTVLVGEQLSTRDEFLGWVTRHFPKRAGDLRLREFNELLRSKKTVTREMLQLLQQLHTAAQPGAQSRMEAMLRGIQDAIQQSGAVSVYGKQDRLLRTQLDFYTWAAEHFPPVAPAPAPGPTASTVSALAKETQQVNAATFTEAEKLLRASAEEGTRLYHEIGSGPGAGMVYFADVVLYKVRGNQVSRTIFSFPADGTSYDEVEAVLVKLGSTPTAPN